MSVEIARTADLEACFALRFIVFVQEQNVPVELEQDELDASAIHLLAMVNGAPMGTARIVLKDGTGKIGRVCVLKEVRGTGIGTKLMQKTLEELRAMPGMTRAILGAQITTLGFYQRLGFTAYGDVFDDAGIDHQMMELRFDT